MTEQEGVFLSDAVMKELDAFKDAYRRALAVQGAATAQPTIQLEERKRIIAMLLSDELYYALDLGAYDERRLNEVVHYLKENL